MSLEVLSTVASIITAAVITATAIAAIVQLRHLRAGNQINALLTLQNELDSENFREADILVRQEMPTALKDRAFCEACLAYARRQPHSVTLDPNFLKIRQAALFIGNTFENMGGLVKNDIFERRLFLEIYSWIVVSYWNQLEGFTAISRTFTGEQTIWENFEYIAALSRKYLEANPIQYPPGMKRLEVRLPEAARGLAD